MTITSDDLRLRAYGLQTEQRHEPLGIDETCPRLSWKLASHRRGAAQSAYRLTAAERQSDLDDPTRLLWDSGLRESTDTVLVPWGGPVLRSATRYHWRVAVWDETAELAGQAESWFEMGLLYRQDWAAVWVGRDQVLLPPVDPPQDEHVDIGGSPLYLRREFTVDSAPIRARLYATARGIYEPRLNGVRVGDHELAPGWTEYHQRIQVQTYDVTAMLCEGPNVLAAVVADGWWCGYVGFDPRRAARQYGDRPAFLAQLVLEFADGSRQVVATDRGWTEGPGPIQSADLLMGQQVDARQHRPGWDTAGAVADGFRSVTVVDSDPGRLVAEPDHPVRITREVAPAAIHRRGPDRFIVDFGQNLVGRVRLTFGAVPRGRRIVLRHAEILAADGGLYVENLRRARATDVYIAAGEDGEVFDPQFTVHGFRYAEVSNYPGDLSATDIRALVLHSDTPWMGTFECSDPLVNQLQSNIAWGQRGNFVAVPTDCPQRDERFGWLADAQIFAPTASRNADVSAFFARWMRDVVDGQGPDGAFRDIAPVVTLDREGAPAWGDAGVIIPWHLWRTYGDRRVLERSYEAMRAWVAHIRRHNPDLRWRHRTGNSYGDWLQVDATTPRDVLATAYFARSTQIVADAAEVLGRSRDAAEHRTLLAAIRAAFIESYVHEDGTVEGGTQTAYLLALAFGLLPEALVPAAVEHLAADVEKRANRLTTGFVGVALLCPVLAEHGRADLAYALLHQEDFPSWGYSIRQGATTIWERWDGWTDHAGFQSAVMNSFNHYSLGSVGDWLYGRVAGIDQMPTSVAYRELLLRPIPGGRLTWARAKQETVRGTVACGWSVSDGWITVTATVPPGSTAVLEVPTSEPNSVRESDAPAAGRPGVLGVVPSAEGVTLRLQSGRYTVSAIASGAEPNQPAITAPSLQET